MTDPYAPFPATSSATFPRARLLRAGVGEATVDRLEGEYGGLDEEGRADLRQFVTSRTDAAILDRYGDGDTGQPAQPASPADPAAGPTYEELNALTVDELEQRVRDWNSAHPDQHLAVSGRKGELIGRLLDAYEGEQGDAFPATPPAPEEPPATPAVEPVPTAPTATTPEGTPNAAPEGAPAAFTPPPGTVDTGDAPSGPQEPAQTADAPGAGAAPSTTPEE